MAIGRPISLTPNIATKNISSLATADQTEFTVTGGYRINEIAVYRNGVRLAEGRDFTASDGDTVNLVTAASVDDVIEVGSCGICAGLEHKNYCVCPTGECKHTYYGWGGDEDVGETGTLQLYINWNSGRNPEERYLIEGVRSADGAEGIAAIEGGGHAVVQWKSLWARVISSGNAWSN